MNIAERIAAKKARALQIKDRLTELKDLTEADDSYELTAEEIQEIDVLSDEMESVNKSIESLQKLEATIASKAAPVGNGRIPAAPGPAAKKDDEGGLLIKVATASLIGHVRNLHPMDVIRQFYGDDERVEAAHKHIVKTATAPASTTEAGWAAELVQDDLQAFLVDLQPISIYAGLRAAGVALNFGGANSVTIPRRAVGGPTAPLNDVGGSWVGEGGVIPVKRIQLGSQTLNRYKTAVISTFSQEIMEQSTPAIEGIVRQSILDDTSIALDGGLLDNSAIVPGVRPAGLMLGVTATNSTGDTAANIISDLKVLFAAMSSANLGAKPVLIMHPDRVLGLSTVTIASGEFLFRDEVKSGHLLGVPLIASANCATDHVYIVDASSFASANDTPTFNVSDQATLTMANADVTAPTQADDGAGAIGTADEVQPGGGIHIDQAANTPNAGYVAQSMFQTYSHALRMVLPTTWGLIRPDAVAAIDQVSW